MTRVLAAVYRASLRLLPHPFRRMYADEMREIFAGRLQAVRGFAAIHVTLAEAFDVAATSVRVRLAHATAPHPALVGTVALAMAATLLTLKQGDRAAAVGQVAMRDSLDISAIDPAGEFTLSIRSGKPVAATMDRVPLPATRLVQQGDSIRFLTVDGNVMLSVAYDRSAARIAWAPRSPSCRGRATSCGSL